MKGGQKKMRFSFKKIGSVLASTAMLSSTVALAAAANFPAPFVTGGTADVAIVHGGANAAYTDLVAVTDVSSFLSTKLAEQTAKGGGAGTSTSVSGEATPLFSGGTKLYVNDTINSVRSTLTKSELATVLKDISFSGEADATITQTIDLGFNPRTTYEKQPSSTDEPTFGLKLSTGRTNYLYNATATFSKAVNLTHADSEGQDITLFGQKFTIASSTDNDNLVLLKTAQRISLSNEDPSSEVVIEGKTYTVELVSTSDTTATVKVTDSTGKSETREVTENSSKKINGITIAVTNADENNLKLSASVIAGAEKITLNDGDSVTKGEEGTVIDGTFVKFNDADIADKTSKIIVSVYAANSDVDAIKSGATFTDPVFGSFKLDFTGLSISSDSTSSARETISVSDSTDDKAEVKFADHRGKEKTIAFAKNHTSRMALQVGDDGRNITVFEKELLRYQDYVVVGNEDEGYLLKLASVKNSTTGTNQDAVELSDVFSGDVYKTTWTSDGSGTVTIGGKSFDVTIKGDSSNASEQFDVRLAYPDSAGNAGIAYPTIQTAKGAKVAFYEPVSVNLSNWDGSSIAHNANLSSIKLPDGDGYTDVTVADAGLIGTGDWNFTFGSTTTRVLTNESGSASGTIGPLTYNISTNATSFTPGATEGDGFVTIRLVAPSGGSPTGTINHPALVIFEEKDDNNAYEALVVTLEAGSSGDDGIGVDDVIRTWGVDDSAWETTSAADSKKAMEGDLWGSIITVDSADSDQKTAMISYPDEQVYALLYMGELGAAITTSGSGGSGATELGSVAITDAEAGSVSSNLVVVGGSCVNTVAAQLLGVSSRTCGADFTAKTGVGAGQFLIETFSRSSGKVATLVAGYNAGDTTNAAKYLTTQTVDTMVGKKYKGTSATSAELMTETA